MPSPYKGFLWRENEESTFWSFHPLADKTNNEHLRKPFLKQRSYENRFKILLGSEVLGNNTKESILMFRIEYISFVLFPKAQSIVAKY